MSWSISLMGNPENVVKSLEDYSSKLDGQSKIEFDSALPNLVGIVKENFGEENAIVKITANGHGTAVNGEQKNRNLSASIERVYTTLV